MIANFISSDIKEVKDVLTKTWVNTYSNIYDEKVIGFITQNWHSVELLLEESNNSNIIFYIYKDNNKISALLSGYKDSKNTIFYLNRLYVLPEFQGKGIGQKLLDRLYTDLKPHYKIISLEVESMNFQAIKFYLKNNFKRKNEFSDIVNGFKTNITKMEKEI